MKERAAEGTGKKSRRARTLPFNWERAALLLVDMQGFFIDPASPAYMPQALPALSNAGRLARLFRERGLPVLFTAHAHKDPARDGGLMALWWKQVCLAGTREAEVASSLGAREGEIFLKCRYSAFANLKLGERLRTLGVDSLVIAGLKTNLCVESTVREAFDLGFMCIVAGDAAAARTEELHLASLAAMADGFAMVRATGEILAEAEKMAAASAGPL